MASCGLAKAGSSEPYTAATARKPVGVTLDAAGRGAIHPDGPDSPTARFLTQRLEDDSMSQSEQHKQQQKLVQYLNEAHATEQALTRVLQSQIAMTPRGAYRTALETHLRETRDHAERVARRLEGLGQGSNPLMAVVGAVEAVVGQALALGKTPFDLLRGSGGEEKVLKNAKDAYATEALEIATYTALQRLASSVGDDETAKLAASILREEEKMLQRILREIPKLTDAVVRADIKGRPSYDITTTGAADTVRDAGEATKDTARKMASSAKRTARKARKVPGVAQAEGQIKGAVASEEDLAIARYDSLTADEITSRLTELSQIDLAKVDSYERRNQNRSTVLSRISTLRGNEPWAGYDELTAAEVHAVLSEGDDDRAKQVREYERAHKNRAGVLQAAERELSNA
jgi:ferritin-like metal-binding protein YciE